MVVFGGHVMRLTLNVCLCGGRWDLRAAVIPPWDPKSALFIPPWELKDALLIPPWHLKSAVFILHGTSRVLPLSPTGPHGCSHPPWGFTGAPFTASPHPTVPSGYSYTPPRNITGYPCGPVVQVTTGVSSSWGYRALSVVSTWTFLTSRGAMLLVCRFKLQT